MTDSPIDNEIPDDLARAFALPAWVQESEGLAELHEAVVTRLRHEAAGLPMNTVQQLLLERIAFNYIVLKRKEETQDWGRGEQKDFNTWWLSMTQEFNKLLMANQDKVREAMLLEIQKIVTESLNLITDDNTRRSVRRHLAGAFAAIDL